MNFTRNYTTENMFRAMGVHPNVFQQPNVSGNASIGGESHSTAQTQKTKGASTILMDPNVVGSHRGKHSPVKTKMYGESNNHNRQAQRQQRQHKASPQRQSPQSRSRSAIRQSQSYQQVQRQQEKQKREQLARQQVRQQQRVRQQSQPIRQQSQQRGNSIEDPSRRRAKQPQHKRSASVPQAPHYGNSFSRRAGSAIGKSTLKLMGCFDGVCDSMSDWWGDHCADANSVYQKNKSSPTRQRGRSRTSRREKDRDYYHEGYKQVMGMGDDDTFGSYSDGTESLEDSLDDATYDSYDDDYLARDLLRRKQRDEEKKDDDSLNSERQRKWKQAKAIAAAMEDSLKGESAIQRQRRIRMEQERLAIEEQRQRFHAGKAMSENSNVRSMTVSQAHTEVIGNTLAQKLITQQRQEMMLEQQQQGEEQQQQDGHNVQRGTRWPEDTAANQHETSSNTSDDDEAQRAFDWIHDPKKREQAWLRSQDSQSVNSRSTHKSRKSQDPSIPFDQSQDASSHWSSQKRSTKPIEDKPSQHWKNLDTKIQSERQELQARHADATKALQNKKQEQDLLLQQRLMALGEHSMNLDLSAIPTTDGSDHAHETHVLQLEQDKQVQLKEQELEILQGAIHQRLSPSAQERREKIRARSLDPYKSQLEKEQEWLANFKAKQAKITQQEELVKEQLDKTIVASNHKPKVPSLDESLPSNDENKDGASPKIKTAVKFAANQDVSFEGSVPPLPASLETEAPPTPKSAKEHKQQITSSFDSEDAQSLEPNPRNKPIQCKVELPALKIVDEEKERRLAEQKRMREEFKASRLQALAAKSAPSISPPSSNKKDPVQALVDDHDAKSKDSKASSQGSSGSSNKLVLTVGSQSFSNMDDISVLTPASTKTMETTQTTQTNASNKSTRSTSLPPNPRARIPVMPPTIQELQGGKKRGESPRLSAKRKELEWMWNAAKKPLQQLEEEQRAKQKKNRVRKLQSIATPGGLEDSSVGSHSTRSSSKRVVEYAPGGGVVDRMPKVWTKKKGGSVTTATTVSSHSSEDNERRDMLLDPPKKNRVSQLVQKQRELSERHRRLQANGRRSPSVSVVPEESDVPSVVTNTTNDTKPNVSFGESKPNASFLSQPSDELSFSTPKADDASVKMVVTPEKQGGIASARLVSTAPVVTPESTKSSKVMNFWEQKEQETLAKKVQQERQQKRESWNQKWSPPSTQKPTAPRGNENKFEEPLSKIELKRRELAAKREAFQKHKDEAAKRLDQELVASQSMSNLVDSYESSQEEEKKMADTKELVGKFEEIKNVLNRETDRFASVRRPPPHRCLADRKQKELDRRNEEYLHSLNQFGRSKSHDTNSSTAWPEMEASPSRRLVAKSRLVEEDAQSNESVPEKEITHRQQLRQAWRQRAWKTLDNKVDRDGFPMESELGAKAVQKVLGKNTTRLAMLTEQY